MAAPALAVVAPSLAVVAPSLESSSRSGTEAPVQKTEAAILRTRDGTELAGQWFVPAGAPRGAALIVPAMGVPQSYYAAFGTWLAEQGLVALSFDFRGSGRSRRGSLRDVDADILTWAEQDAAAALQALEARAPGVPITWIGHSLGGQIVPFVEHRRIAKVITVGTGSGYWRENAPQLRRRVWIFWWLAVPALTPLFGYFPGKRLGMVGDLPRGVITQWRRWCLHPEYAVGDGEHMRASFATVTTPITSLSFTDDEMMSEANTASIHGFYTSAPRTMRRIAPADVGVRRIGHFGFFRAEMRAPLWEAVLRDELVRTTPDPA